MAEMAEPVEHQSHPATAVDPRYRLLQVALLGLRAGPALILLLLVVAGSLTTPVFFTSLTKANAK